MRKLFKKYGSFIFWLSIILIALYIFFWVVIDGPTIPAYKFFELSLFYIFLILYLVFFFLGFILHLVLHLSKDSSEEDRERILEFKEQRSRNWYRRSEITVFDKLIFHHGSPFELGDSWESGLFFYFFLLPIMGFFAFGIAFVFIILPLGFISGLILIIDEQFGTAWIDYIFYMFDKIFN
jgi:hypothetical protein